MTNSKGVLIMPVVIEGADDHNCPFCGGQMVNTTVYNDGYSVDCKCVDCGKEWTCNAERPENK